MVFAALLTSGLGCSQEVGGLGHGADDMEDDPNGGRVRLDGGSKDASRAPAKDAGSEGETHAGDDAASGAGHTGISAEDGGVPACSLAGNFAMQVEFDLDWDMTRVASLPTIGAGTGTLSVYALASVQRKDGQYEAMVRPCGTAIPDFYSASSLFPEQYGVYVSDSAWDKPTMPSWRVSWLLACHDPGCPIQTSVLDAWVGAEPRDSSVRIGRGMRSAVGSIDVDSDLLPGLTVWTKGPETPSPNGGTYERPLVGLGLRGRVSRMMMGIAMRAHFGGQLSSCDEMSGESNDGEVGAVAFGCMSRLGAAPEAMCDEPLSSVLDQSLPAWRVRSGRYVTRRIAEETCGAVRAHFSLPVSP